MQLRSVPELSFKMKTQWCCRFLKRVSFAASNLEQPVRSAP
jgi:hypothetical protein